MKDWNRLLKKRFFGIGLIVAFVLNITFATNLVETKDVQTMRTCRVEPHEGPPIEVSRVFRIYPPWTEHNFVTLRFPESLWTSNNWLFMCNHPGLGGSPMPLDEPANVWKSGADGSLWYERVMVNAGCAINYEKVSGITYGAKITSERDFIDMEFYVKNDTGKGIQVGVDFCFFCMYNGQWNTLGSGRGEATGGEFADYKAERTFMHTKKGWLRLSDGDRGPLDGKLLNGRWTLYPVEGGRKLISTPAAGAGASTDAADEALIAVVSSSDSRRIMAMAWPNPSNLMNNTSAPCIHCSPILPNVPAGDKIVVKGKIYFHEGTLDQLYKQYLADFGHLWEQQHRAKKQGDSYLPMPVVTP